MTKKLYYLTTDPVNAFRAKGLAADENIDLELAEPRDLPCLEQAAANVVLDWDYLPREHCDHLLNGPAVRVVGVHSYDLSDSVASFLARRGIVVSRHLDQAFVAALVERSRAA
jgi:hypothetical protein